MKLLRKMSIVGKWAVIIYVVQALAGIAVGVYMVATLDPAEIERMVSCVK